ncbi:MAG: SRPBCC domain-containing protein [Acidimicrobiales bacterium]|nr:SRPBCC domain-containing protein [Acidimicrobiales bacterium]
MQESSRPAPETTDDELSVVVSSPTSAAPVQVWDVIVNRTGAWWGEPYLGPDRAAMRMEPVLGGRVYSGNDPDWGDLHGTVRAFDPPERLEIGGVLVPGAYAGSITISVSRTNLGSEVRVEQKARGRIEASVEERISHGWTTMLHALAELADE